MVPVQLKNSADHAHDRDFVVLVDEQDRDCGVCEKLEAHQRGLRHRAFSVFLKNGSGQWLLQRRAAGKYHSAGLWANSCCGHPMLGEATDAAARRRLGEELGIRATLHCLRWHSYRAEVTASLVENELVGIFLGRYDGPVHPDPAEVSEWRWAEPEALLRDTAANPQCYTAWFRNYLAAFGPELAAWRDTH